METITVHELKARLDKGEKINLIDCREPAEFAEYNIGATLIPLGEIQRMQLGVIEGKENEEIIIHCRSGKRSCGELFCGPADAGKAVAGALRRKIGDGNKVHARRAAYLRQKHRAELAGADQGDAQRPVLRRALGQQFMQIHAEWGRGTITISFYRKMPVNPD